MKKLAAALIASLFATAAFAQASAPAVTGAGQSAAAPTTAPKARVHKVAHHHKAKSFKLDKSKLNGKDTLQ